MTSPAKTIELSRLDALENAAKGHYEAAKRAWKLCVETCLEIQASGLWAIEHPDLNWEEYAEQYLPITASTIRGYKQLLPMALLAETVTGETLSKTQAVKLSETIKAVCIDSSLILPSYQLAIQTSKEVVPPREHLQAAYKTVSELKASGTVSLDNGESVNFADLVMETAALQNLEAIQKETKQRIIDHAKPSHKWTVTIDFSWLSILKLALPKGFPLPDLGDSVTLVWRKKEDEQ